MRATHLVRRFVAALRRGPPPAADEQWAAALLSPGERELFERLPNHDRRHAIHVARRAQEALGADCEARWIVAALLHDVGKHDAGLSVPGRALATVAVIGSSGPDRVARWERGGGVRRRISSYARHGELGAAEIRAVEGCEEAALWSAAHHRPETWPTLAIPPHVVDVLDAADQI